MEPVVRLPAEAAPLHLPGQSAGHALDQASYHGEPGRDHHEFALTKREAIVWRRTVGISESENLATLDARRVELEGERARLESEIRDASARQTLGTTAERRLGMHIPTDKQVVILPRARRNESP